MAENKDGQEKTEEPTAKKLDDGRKKGQVARSRELNTMAVTMIGAMALVGMSGHLGTQLSDVMTSNFTLTRDELFEPVAMLQHLADAILDALWMLTPFFLILMAVAVLSSVALGGLAFSMESLAPKFNKLNPISGMKRIFSAKGLMELVKALLKFVFIAGVTGLVLVFSLEDFIGLSRMEIGPALSEVGNLVGGSFILLTVTLILIAMMDVPFQIWDHKKQMRMTKQEVREEMKQTEGRPEVKNRIRSLQREMAQRRMMEAVPQADVVVTNPTHYAVALRYEQDSMAAPKVVARGKELVAANIRKVASEHDVPLVESPMLARAIYFHTELGDAIPAGLYLAVAKLLAYVFQLQVYRRDGGDLPQVPDDVPVPEEYQHGTEL
ncbi:Flagellar biosynthesis protein FlhB [hydrothermal vent metagenome]|uniref:Flagellar biosynthetic protein FlhB n=1 Tax=hydrothermal vent metagenome TaxID=652676 RepID=A0A3B1BHI3_9ZZZZ